MYGVRSFIFVSVNRNKMCFGISNGVAKEKPPPEEW